MTQNNPQGPEVLKRHPIGFRVDLYGFGVMIWEMYSSKLPWSDCTLEQMTHKVAIANERPPGKMRALPVLMMHHPTFGLRDDRVLVGDLQLHPWKPRALFLC